MCSIRSETLRDHARATRSERRFGVEREPVVTYARARMCRAASAAFASNARPPRDYAVRGSGQQRASANSSTAHRAREPGERTDVRSFDLSVRRFLERASAPALPILVGRDAPIEAAKQQLLCRSLLNGRRRSARARTRGQADRRATILSLIERRPRWLNEAFLRKNFKRLP